MKTLNDGLLDEGGLGGIHTATRDVRYLVPNQSSETDELPQADLTTKENAKEGLKSNSPPNEPDSPPVEAENNDGTSSFVDVDTSFNCLDLEDVLSHHSFEYIRSEIDDLEKLSESFIHISIEGNKIKTYTGSVFENLSSKDDPSFTFIENQVVAKALNLCHKF